MPLWVRVLAGAELHVRVRAEVSCVAAQVDKYRPHSLDKLIVHQDVGENLRNLVRLCGALRTPPPRPCAHLQPLPAPRAACQRHNALSAVARALPPRALTILAAAGG